MSSKIRIALIALAATALLAAGANAAAASAADKKTKTLTDHRLKVTVTIPAAWKRIPHRGGDSFGYAGKSGWMEFGASSESGGLRHTCRMAAVGTASIHIYGKHPHVTFRKIDGRPGCLIMPSRDAPRTAVVENGPKFQDAEALVAYRRPVYDVDRRWPLLVIFGSRGHIRSIVRSVRLHH